MLRNKNFEDLVGTLNSYLESLVDMSEITKNIDSSLSRLVTAANRLTLILTILLILISYQLFNNGIELRRNNETNRIKTTLLLDK